jgi:hypothetical protein
VLAAGAGQARAQQTTPADDKSVPQKIEVGGLEMNQAAAFVLPLPSEIVQLLKSSKVGARIAASVGQTPHNYKGMPEWKAALNLGITTADLVIGIETLPTSKVVSSLDDMRAGMAALGVSQEQLDKIDELRGAVASGAMEKEKLVAQFDVMRVEMLTKGRAQLGDRNFALIAVGGWSRAANLAATAAKDDPASLSDLEVLKLRSVVETLIQWLGSDAEVQPIVANLQKVLPITDESKPAPPTAKDVDVLIDATGSILNLAK